MAVPIPEFFKTSSESPWMPGLAPILAGDEWTRIERTLGLDRRSYGTVRYARRDRSAPRNVVGDVTAPACFGNPATVVIEELDADISLPYRAMGLGFAAMGVITQSNAAFRLNAALATISLVPDLAMTLGHLLGAIHVLQSPSADYDVSHSDPAIPFSVFIGVTLGPGPLDRLRLAEELVHECMHLQLTLLEGRLPLVRGNVELHPSPWQGRLRPTQGVLHGFYVFATLDSFFCRLAVSGGLNPAEVTHVTERRRAIAMELAIAADALSTSHELTNEGLSLVTELRRRRFSEVGTA